MQEEDLWDMSDEDLEAAFKESKAAEQSPDTDYEAEQSANEDIDASEQSTEETDADEEVSLDGDADDEIDDGPEQPEDNLEDSGHNTSDDSETEEDEAEDDAEADTEDPDKDSETEEASSSEDSDEDEDEEQPAQNYKFRANNKDYEFSSDEIVEQFPKIFGQAMDYTKKMQAIKPWRKTIDAIEGAELNHEDISLMIDVLKGDKDAITEVLKRTGTDTLELDTEADSTYTTKDYGRDDSALAIKDVIDDISQDVEYATTHNILSKEWDERSWATMSKSPDMIKQLHTDVKSGMFKTLQPLAEKLKVYGGASKSDLDYYKDAAQQHFTQVAEREDYGKRQVEKQTKRDAKEAEQTRLTEVKAQTQQRTATKQASAKRKAAAPTKNATASNNVVDYLGDSDEEFDDWYKQLQEDS
jgi:hypothetical protein